MLLLLLNNLGFGGSQVGERQVLTILTVGTSTQRMVASSSSQVHPVRSTTMHTIARTTQNVHFINSRTASMRVGISNKASSIGTNEKRIASPLSSKIHAARIKQDVHKSGLSKDKISVDTGIATIPIGTTKDEDSV